MMIFFSHAKYYTIKTKVAILLLRNEAASGPTLHKELYTHTNKTEQILLWIYTLVNQIWMRNWKWRWHNGKQIVHERYLHTFILISHHFYTINSLLLWFYNKLKVFMVLFKGLPEGTSFIRVVHKLSKHREDKKKAKVNLNVLITTCHNFSPNFPPENTWKPTLFLNCKSTSV